mmetsp:Transcript_15267/g.21923  ORF Transcript_15267/g.21923 Transcript_15267/m.21923 type:complete len:91 (-) Transcript_15267:611-883(-)
MCYRTDRERSRKKFVVGGVMMKTKAHAVLQEESNEGGAFLFHQIKKYKNQNHLLTCACRLPLDWAANPLLKNLKSRLCQKINTLILVDKK